MMMQALLARLYRQKRAWRIEEGRWVERISCLGYGPEPRVIDAQGNYLTDHWCVVRLGGNSGGCVCACSFSECATMGSSMQPSGPASRSLR